MTNGDIIPGAMHVKAVFTDIREGKGVYITVFTKYYTTDFNIDNKEKCFLNIKSAY